MQLLMTDHVFYTHHVIVAIAFGLDDALGAYVDRLLRNQDELGALIGELTRDASFGRAAAGLLREHIVIAKELVEAVKDGRTATSQDATSRWYKNGNAIAEALESKDDTLQAKEAFKKHLDQTVAETLAIVRDRDMAAAIVILDEANEHMIAVGKLLVDTYNRWY